MAEAEGRRTGSAGTPTWSGRKRLRRGGGLAQCRQLPLLGHILAALALRLLTIITRAVLIDAYDEERAPEVLEKEGVEEIVLFLSHSDRDHIRGVQYVLDNFDGTFVAFFCNADRLSARRKSDYLALLRAVAARTRQVPNRYSANLNTNLNHDARSQSLVDAPVKQEVLHPGYHFYFDFECDNV